ncbi:MAG: ABC transporter permease [Gammaproteobacteria bacterium]
MKLIHLIWSGLWRSPTRSVFTLLSVVVAFVLFGLLQGLNAGFDRAIRNARLDGLNTNRRVPGGPPMPLSGLRQIERIPGVILATQRAYFLGAYQEPKNMVAILAVDAPKWFAVRPAFAMSESDRQKFMGTRDAIVATPALVRQFGWKIGQRIPFVSQTLKRDGSATWELELVGTFDSTARPNFGTLALMHYDYFDAARATERGTVDQFMIRINDPNRSAQISLAIDKLFANSPYETRTRSEKEATQSRLKQMGDINLLANAIVASVFFTLLFLTGNTMRQSIRERIPEFAVLKTLGFSDSAVFALVFAEALVLCLIAAALGLVIASVGSRWATDIIGPIRVSWWVIGGGMAVAILVALISAALPAWKVRQLRVVDALAGR